jgi:hypothetical protein
LEVGFFGGGVGGGGFGLDDGGEGLDVEAFEVGVAGGGVDVEAFDWEDADVGFFVSGEPDFIVEVGLLEDEAGAERMGCSGSAVGFATVLDGQHENGIAEIAEANAVVASAETKLRRFNALQALDIAFARGEIASQNVEDMESRVLIDGAQVSSGPLGPGDLLAHSYWPGAESSGVRAMRSKSSVVRPSSASTSS